MSDDEFDNIPDDFADIPNVDWTELLARPSRPAETRLSHAVEPLAETGQISLLHEANDSTSSTHYFSDSDEMDASFFAELDCVEQRLTRTSEAPLTVIASGAGIGHCSTRSVAIRLTFSAKQYLLLNLKCSLPIQVLAVMPRVSNDSERALTLFADGSCPFTVGQRHGNSESFYNCSVCKI